MGAQCIEEWSKLVRSLVHPTVDEERGRVSHSVLLGALPVLRDVTLGSAGGEVPLEGRHVERKFPREALVEFLGELLLVLEQPIVHQPELRLFARGLSDLRCAYGVRADLRLRMLTERKSDLALEFPEQLVNDGLDLRAVRALVVPVLDRLITSPGRAGAMVPFLDR